MITEQLLCVVLDLPYDDTLNMEVLPKYISYEKVKPNGTIKYKTINIYELAHKCKEWAFWNDYRIIVKMTIPDIYRSEYKINYKYEVYHTDGILDDACTWFDSEPEAIFEACQYILDNKGTE